MIAAINAALDSDSVEISTAAREFDDIGSRDIDEGIMGGDHLAARPSGDLRHRWTAHAVRSASSFEIDGGNCRGRFRS